MTEPSVVNQLLVLARASQPCLDVVARMREQVTALVLELDDALAELQRDPGDVGESLKRAFVLRGTVDNIMEKAFSEKVERHG